MLKRLDKSLFNKDEKKIFAGLNSPTKIQAFLNALKFNFDNGGDTMYSPREVIRMGRAHCMEGAMFAGVALWWHGEPPLLLDLRTDVGDEDHVVALFKKDGCFGAISKTNHGVLRYREPVYETLRELVMSYFHEYFLPDGSKTLREYGKPFDLSGIRDQSWIISSENLWHIEKQLDNKIGYGLLTAKQINGLRKADKIERTMSDSTEYDE